MKRSIYLFIILFSAAGLLINCNGAKRPWHGNQPGTDDGNQPGADEGPVVTPGPTDGGTQGGTQIVFANVQSFI